MNINPPSTRASSEVDIHQPNFLSDDDNDIEAEIIWKANKKISKTCHLHLSRDLPIWQPKILKKRFGGLSSMPSMKNGQRSLEKTTGREYKPPTYSSSVSNAQNLIYTDSGSTGAMREHVAACWGKDVWNEAKSLDLDPAKDVVKNFKTMKNVRLTEMFAQAPGSKETFSLSPPSREAIWYVFNLLPVHF